MTRSDFARVMAYIGTACGKPLTADGHEVYFDLLGDLPFDVMQLAARRVMLEHKWATFPSVAELRQAAAETVQGRVTELTPAEAWALAWRIASDTDPEVGGSFERACRRAKAPPVVVEALTAFGVNAICYGEDPVGVTRGQFLKVFEQLQGRDRRLALLPPTVRQAVEARRPAAVAGPAPARAIVGALADSIGMPEGT